MLEINLLPVREARRAADLRGYVAQTIGMLLLTLVSIAFVESQMADKIGRTEDRVAQMQHDIDQFKPQLDKVAAFKKRKNQLEKKIDVIDGLDRARSGPVRMLDELAVHAPERLWLKSLTTKGKEIQLHGESLDNELVAVFLRALGESPYFDQVDLDSTELGAKGSGLKLVSFKIQALLVTPKKQSVES